MSQGTTSHRRRHMTMGDDDHGDGLAVFPPKADDCNLAPKPDTTGMTNP